MGKVKTKGVDNGGFTDRLPNYNIFGKQPNTLMRALLADNPSPENKALIRDIERLEADLSDARKWEGYTNAERDELQQRMLHEVQMSHWERCSDRKQKLDAELEAFRESWLRKNHVDGSERLANMQRYRTEIKLDDSNLEATLLEAASASTPEQRAAYDPDRLYAMAEHAADKGLTGTLGVAKSALQNCNVSQPWLNTDKGDELATAIDDVTTEYGITKTNGGELAAEISELITVV
jgi:hypothetical protein